MELFFLAEQRRTYDIQHSSAGSTHNRVMICTNNNHFIFFGNREIGGHENQWRDISTPSSAEYGGGAATNVNEISHALKEAHPLL